MKNADVQITPPLDAFRLSGPAKNPGDLRLSFYGYYYF
jgi:hypothetical protein